jgi:deoxyadenosine kinase
MRKPNIIVHLDVSPEESLRRIKMRYVACVFHPAAMHSDCALSSRFRCVCARRSRDCESSITIEYLRGLARAYDSFIEDIARVIPVIRVDYSTFRTTAVRPPRVCCRGAETTCLWRLCTAAPALLAPACTLLSYV